MSLIRLYKRCFFWPLLLIAYAGITATLVRWAADRAAVLYGIAFWGTTLLLLNGYVIYMQDRSSRETARFLTHINHEIRTPLTVISGIGEILNDQPTLDDKQKQLVKALVASTVILKTLTDDILNFCNRS